jgi:hypothetical protein
MSVAVFEAARLFAHVGFLVEAFVKKTPFSEPNIVTSVVDTTPIVPAAKAVTGSFWYIADAFAAIPYSLKPWLSLFCPTLPIGNKPKGCVWVSHSFFPCLSFYLLC